MAMLSPATMTVGQAKRYVGFREPEKDLGNPGAFHYRGRVKPESVPARCAALGSRYGWPLGRPNTRWHWEVINTRTGAVVAEDGPYYSFPEVMTECARKVLAVREAWTQGYLRKRFL